MREGLQLLFKDEKDLMRLSKAQLLRMERMGLGLTNDRLSKRHIVGFILEWLYPRPPIELNELL